MLRITACVSANAAMSYFRDALMKGDYYTSPGLLKGQEIVGEWGGLAAERLGVSGRVTPEAFENLCNNLHPATGDRLTPRTKTDRRVLYDFTFSVPKSVSVVAELMADARITDAFRDSVRETLIEMEAAMKTRVRRKGEDGDRVTGNMVWGEFTHFTSRPVEGVPDMHHHIHATVFNCTWDEVERRWKAGEFGDIKRDAPYYQAACDARLATKLATLGYAVERRGDGPGAWEIAGVPDSVVRTFSRRTEEIERIVADLGITDPDAKAAVGQKSRGRKQKSFTMEELREEWFSRLSPEERKALNAVGINASLRLHAIPNLERTAERAIDHAIKHTFERWSVTSEKRLLEAALVWGIGHVTVDAVAEQLAGHVAGGHVLRATVDGEPTITTKSVLEEEQRMLATVRDGRGQHAPLDSAHTIADRSLSPEQRAAVRHVLESTDSVILIRGRAGVGKTKMMQEVVGAIEATGRIVQAAAPTAMATHEVLRKDGFRNAETVAAILGNRESMRKLQNQVLWVDEAGLLSMPDLARLVHLADVCNARLILSGDTRQHRSVVRGDALRLLESEAGLVPAELKQVRRQQRGDYREAAEALSRGDLVGGYTKLDAMGAIKEAAEEKRYELIAEVYIDSLRRGQSVLTVAPTHLEGRLVTEAVREKLKSEKVISGEDVSLTRLHNRQLTEAQRGEMTSYREHDVVQFHQNAQGGFRPRDRATVLARTSTDVVMVQRARDGAMVPLPLPSAKAFQVFEQQDLKIAKGDRVRITYNGHDASGKHRLNNGAIYKVADIDKSGGLVLDNGWKLPQGFGHVTHGYAVTSDAAQGRTVDHVIIAQSELSSAASNIQQWYTSVTRGRHEVTIVTDHKQRLLEVIARDNSRMSATELMKLAATPPKERGIEHRRHAGLWMAKENTRRMKEEVNRHLRREDREIVRRRQEAERKRQHRSREGGMTRER